MARIYSYSKNDEEKTYDFLEKGNWHINFQVYLMNQPSETNLQVLEDCTIVSMKKQDVLNIYTKYPRTERIDRICVERALLDIICKKKYSRDLSSYEMYLHILETKPDWLQQIPQKHLASYLDIKLESLSRIKKNRISHYFHEATICVMLR